MFAKRWAVLGLLGFLASCDKPTTSSPQRPRVQIQRVQIALATSSVNLTGDIEARVQAPLSFRVDGKVIERNVDVGDRISPRQILARLDPKDLQNGLNSANAAVEGERARLDQTTASFKRQEKLLPQGYTSRSEYDAAQAAMRSSQSSLAAAQAQLANAREQLSYTALLSEGSGVITARHAEVGQVVQATQPIFTFARDGDRDAVFDVYESLVPDAMENKSVSVSLVDDPEVKAVGRVREVTPQVSNQTGTVRVKIALSSLPKGMQLGAVVSASIEPPAGASVELPWAALTKNMPKPGQPGRTAVWALEGDRVKLREVTVARYLTGKVIISDGLHMGDQIVVSGGQLLHPDMLVEVINEGGQ